MRRRKLKLKKHIWLPPAVLAKRRTWWEQRGFRFSRLTEVGKEKEQRAQSIAEVSCGELALLSNETANAASSSLSHTVLSSDELPSEEDYNRTVSPTQVFDASARDMELIDEEESIVASDPFTRMDGLLAE